jgi:hypothetical protein
MKIYLAGAVSQNGWRTKLVAGAELDASQLPDDREWPVLEHAIFGEYDYVGPFLYGCDHGCYHGTHGMAPSEKGCCGRGGFERAEIVRRCLDAVRRADLVFCWLEAPEDYGSMIEVGFALALGMQVAIGAAAAELAESHWFASSASSLAMAVGPEEALRVALERVRTHGTPASPSSTKYELPVEVWRKCESPIERSLMVGVVAVASRAGVRVIFKLKDKDISLTTGTGTPMVIWPQRQVCNHRADFVVEYAGSMAVVECDGHAYHERTKKQAERDRGLDRAFQREGFRIFRFTGSEIWAGPEACAATLIRDLQSATT